MKKLYYKLLSLFTQQEPIFDEFNSLVYTELCNLRHYLTKNQRESLSFEKLDGNNTENCIYGQLFGWGSSSSDAKKIKYKCASYRLESEPLIEFLQSKDLVLLTPINSEDSPESLYGLTPLELYLMANCNKVYSDEFRHYDEKKAYEVVSFLKRNINYFNP